jgi:hypothetical protein
MEVFMSNNPNLMTMNKAELRAYVLTHREDEEALQVYLDLVGNETPKSRIYSPEENVEVAIEQYMQARSDRER